MKKYFSLYFLFFICNGYSQSISSSVISSSGKYFTSTGYSLTTNSGQPLDHTFSSAGNKLTQGFIQPELDLKTNLTLDSICSGNLDIPFYSTGYIGTNNVFTAQLSDASGSFTNAVNIGTTTGNSPGLIHALIPSAVLPGQGYRIRIISSLPVKNSTGKSFVLQICSADLTMYAFIEGLYDNNSHAMRSPLNISGLNNNMTACDSITIEIRNAQFPYALFNSQKVLLKKDGTMQCSVPSAAIGNNYYIIIKSRNAIETWSKLPVSFGNTTVIDMRY
jgi:hypothetical protein